MLSTEVGKTHFFFADLVERVFPSRGEVGIDEGFGKDATHRRSNFCRDEVLPCLLDEAALFQLFDHSCTRRLRADARTLFERCGEFFVVDVLMDFLHCF